MHTKQLRSIGLFFLAIFSLNLSGASELKMLVPAYFYPAGDGLLEWDKLIEAAKTTDIIAIMNPNSGVGKKRIQSMLM
jgi:hypothetical protein